MGMPMAGQGMLLTSMNIDAEHEIDFNRWYDREHLAERVAIPGFIEARRYVAENASLKYLSLYSTRTFDVLDSPAYRTALANQTAWSKANIARFKDMLRAVARITVSRGQGRGVALAIIRIRADAAAHGTLREALIKSFAPELHDGIISMHLLESDPALSRSLTDPTATDGASDWYVLIDGTSEDAVAFVMNDHVTAAVQSNAGTIISAGTYRLLFDLAVSDL